MPDFPHVSGTEAIRAASSQRGKLAGVTSYAGGVEPVPQIEDWRGVDVSQIRRQLRMTVPERVRTMVDAANVLIGIQDHARQARSAEAS